uniref:Non-specific lipid-transfer protein n=2 Tax=Zea mays TaxID=4577 RepID=A0A804UL66_MAIZE
MAPPCSHPSQLASIQTNNLFFTSLTPASNSFSPAIMAARSSSSQPQLVAAAAVLAAALLLLAAGAGTASAAVSCGEVTSSVAPCLGYAMGSAASPSAACCSGVRSLNSRASSTADRQATCNCLKSMTGRLGGGVSMANAANIPSKCGVSVGVPISPTVDCTKYVGPAVPAPCMSS